MAHRRIGVVGPQNGGGGLGDRLCDCDLDPPRRSRPPPPCSSARATRRGPHGGGPRSGLGADGASTPALRPPTGQHHCVRMEEPARPSAANPRRRPVDELGRRPSGEPAFARAQRGPPQNTQRHTRNDGRTSGHGVTPQGSGSPAGETRRPSDGRRRPSGAPASNQTRRHPQGGSRGRRRPSRLTPTTRAC